ncbi:unnamed protein product, partial [Mesorhabditis belari]|uniref:KIX domain-containing protein n=1 Tax=Mesorhabditis belari TaxID=2138241 RepID=A0AAF3EA29_9BILA
MPFLKMSRFPLPFPSFPWDWGLRNTDPFRSPNPPPNKPIGGQATHQLIANKGMPGTRGEIDYPPPESPDPAVMQDQRIRDLISYVRKVEKEMFEIADDREEYYHLLAEKIYKIQKEFRDQFFNANIYYSYKVPPLE